ncbi:2-oxo acid dehydrogenase subunit E2 [Spirochaeta isovalerica]|uniref:Pyruvate/2-oxoglutarate dehydrogenase complex dihydrolipoamide acyltransferase (E2) component n=1 Tax=Spirochaeta isovalerica TaxID=150 RepID=A0A841RAY6_9SPIO|nr:2-oxo acid dehydrogenase subunit E2 [Spirochaeta isovalerica]MBB6480876.1 pyruvate/2-oxoglutarate dehydrogenase complex dihydrolipoamide acyltransferase (E2) component [Spirochaeta isovalerica]
MGKEYTQETLSFLRKMVRASAAITAKKNTIHSMTEVDISIPLSLIRQIRENGKEKLSFTAYLVSCLAKTIEQFPRFNSFISGRRLVLLKDVNISVLMERKIGEEYVPEPLALKTCQEKGIGDIHKEIREAQKRVDEDFGSLGNMKLIKYIPGFLLKIFVSMADRNKAMGAKYGKLAITSVGMFCREPVWFIPHGSATVLLTVGSRINRVIETPEGFQSRIHQCLTVSFDHDIIDGAPAARFMEALSREIMSGNLLKTGENEND